MSTLESPGESPSPSPTAAPTVDVRLLSTAGEMAAIIGVFQQVWGTATEVVPTELLMAISHSGGYVSGAFQSGSDGAERLLGASVGFLARHHGRPALHSHVTGLLPEARRTGTGRAIKLHQHAWARQNGLECIVWTFDPLVRRNAWFNLAVLGAEVHDYLESFYGVMSDSINAGDESDRLLVTWEVTDDVGDRLRDAGHSGDAGDAELIPTPEDIVALRRADPAEAARWRLDLRDRLGGAVRAGRQIRGFTRAGEYVIGPGA